MGGTQINPCDVLKRGLLIPSEHTKIQQVGIDLSISEPVTFSEEERWRVVRLNEEMHLPEDVFALLFPRSTMFRLGFIVQCGVCDPGYHGKPVITIFAPDTIRETNEVFLDKGFRVVQAIFFKADSASAYNGSYQGEGIWREKNGQNGK